MHAQSGAENKSFRLVSSLLRAIGGSLVILLSVAAVIALTTPFAMMTANRGFLQVIVSSLVIGVVGFVTSWYNWLSAREMVLGLLPLEVLFFLAIPSVSELPLFDTFNLGWLLWLNLLVCVPWLLGLAMSLGIRWLRKALA